MPEKGEALMQLDLRAVHFRNNDTSGFMRHRDYVWLRLGPRIKEALREAVQVDMFQK